MKLSTFFLLEQEDGKYKVFRALKDFARGKINRYELVDSDDSIYKVIETQPKGLSDIIIDFKGDNLLEKLGLDEDDVWFIKGINSAYNNYEFYDTYTTEQSVSDGWDGSKVWDDESWDLVNKLTILLNGKEILGSKDDDSLRKELFDKINLLFPRKYKDYVGEFNEMVNRQMREEAEETVDRDLKNFATKNNFDFYNGYESVKMKVIDLLNMYAETGKFDKNLENLFEIYFEKKMDHLGGWSENQFEYEDSRKYDKDHFNWEIKKIFEYLLEELEEKPNFKEFLDLYDRISEKFPFEKSQDLPRDKKIKFYIKSINPDTLKIEVRLSNGLRQITHSFSEENFYKLLYQPELFDILDKLKY